MQVRTPPPNRPTLRSWEIHTVSASPLPGPSLVVPVDVRNPGWVWKIPTSPLLLAYLQCTSFWLVSLAWLSLKPFQYFALKKWIT